MACFSPLNLQTSDYKMKAQITEMQAKFQPEQSVSTLK